jgi:hypothetical protein
MELLLTGFVLIGLLQLPGHLDHLQETWWLKIEGSNVFKSYLIGLPIAILQTGIRIMTINLVLLLLLRGFWIGMIGLSSAFPKGINHEQLSFSKRFSNHLRQTTPDTENLIIRLDVICSSIFALSFLVFFIFISLGFYLVQMQVWVSINNYFGDFAEEGGGILFSLLVIISTIVLFIYITGAIFKFIDFIGIGVLKKRQNKWFNKPYFFISQFVSYVSLAFLYRPIYYILVSNSKKRVIRVVLFVYMLIAMVVFFNFGISSAHVYYPDYFRNAYELSFEEYENLRPSTAGVIQHPIIQSDIIKEGFVRLFIPYNVSDNNKLKSICPELKPLRQKFTSRIPFLKSTISKSKADVRKSLDCFSSLYRVSVDDSTYRNLKFFFYRHPNNNEPGIIVILPVSNLEHGYHSLKILKSGNKDPQVIQFWKE